MTMIIYLIGRSGSGKYTTVKQFEKYSPLRLEER